MIFGPLTKELEILWSALAPACVYPGSVLTMANQLETKHLAGVVHGRQLENSCAHPVLGQPDYHIKASKEFSVTRNPNPFGLLSSIIRIIATLLQRTWTRCCWLDDDLKSCRETPIAVL